MTEKTYDYLIIGAGTAGCVLANRLSRNPNTSVCLIEAGGKNNTLLVNMPMGCGVLQSQADFALQFKSKPEQHSNNRIYSHPRGIGLGGSSAINGMVYIRGQHQDYDDWAAGGATGWDSKSVLPYFKKAENQQHGANEWHGDQGPFYVGDVSERHPIEQTLIDAGLAAGLPLNTDFNGAHQAGIGRYQCAVKNGSRVSGRSAYLDPIQDRKNLTILTNSMVQRITFDGTHATGVVVKQKTQELHLQASREVLLSAGALQSPQLLQLSGIGPANELLKHEIEMVADAPQVGQNLQDHVGPPMAWKMKGKNGSLNHRMRFPVVALEALNYLLFKRGSMTRSAASVGIFADSSGLGGRPDLQFHCLPMSGDLDYELEQANGKTAVSNFSGLTMMPYATRPKSRGSITLKSSQLNELAEVHMNYFDDPDDMQVIVRGMQLAQKIAETEPLAQHIETRIYPPAEANDEDAFAEFTRAYGHTGFHPVGTCRMGSDSASVVDCDLKVRGVSGLRVVDASVMPTLISGNTNATTMMIAEKIAERIIADQAD